MARSSAVTKSVLAAELAEHLGVKKREALNTIDSFLGLIESHLGAGEKVTLSGFCNIQVKESAARMGRNPQTGKPMKIKAKRRLKFSALKRLKDAVV